VTQSDNAKRYGRSAEGEQSSVGDRVVLYHRVSQKALVLNPTGSAIWGMLSTPCTATEIVNTLGETHRGVPPGVVERDVEDFLAELRLHELIVEFRS